MKGERIELASCSMSDAIRSPRRTEFPFPPVDPPRPRTPSTGSDATPPYMSRSLPSVRSSTTTKSHRRHRAENEPHLRKDDDRESRESRDSSARLLSRIVSRSDRDNKHIRTLLFLTNDRLDAETRRADLAEQRVVDVLQRLRMANDATAVAQAEASRAQQEVRLYQIQLEQAQKEILRAQEIVDRLERARVDAEEESARARSEARKCKERWVVANAHEEGRQQGFREGLERGRRLALAEARGSSVRHQPARVATPGPTPPLRMSPAPIYADDVEDMEDDADDVPMDVDRQYERRPAAAPIPVVQRVSPPPQ